MDNFDLIIIGSGPGGEKAAVRAAQLGADVLVIEKEKKLGGASVSTGTIPSKAIRETAHFIGQIKNKKLHGFNTTVPKNMSTAEIYHRHRIVSGQLSNKIKNEFNANNIKVVQGTASFVDNQTVIVDDRVKYHAPKIIIATGSQPYHPVDVDFDHHLIHDSDSILTIKNLPKKMIIYGAGVIGCEYASIFNHLGVKIILINPKDNLLSFVDQQVSDSLREHYFEHGITLHSGYEYSKIFVENGIVNVKLKNEKSFTAECLLYCNGRKGVSEQLNLTACGLQSNSRSQLDVNSFYQTSNPNIYAVGDIIGFPSLASTANEQGRMAAQHAVFGSSSINIDVVNMPLGIYTIPEIAMIGLTESQLKQKSISYQTGICYFDSLAKASLQGVSSGFLKILFDPDTKKILGVHIIGEQASELIHIAQAVICHAGKLNYFIERSMNFPTYGSAYKVAAQNGFFNAKNSSR